MDVMLRPINEMEWPYMLKSMYNELNSVCVACEGIVCGERVEAYKAMVDLQEKHIIRWNQQIYNAYNDLLLQRSKINKDSDPHLYCATEIL